MKSSDLASLLRRGAAAIETPGDLTDDEIDHVIEDLCVAADELEGRGDLWDNDHIQFARLISEGEALGIFSSGDAWEQIKGAMDLENDELGDLISRAQKVFADSVASIPAGNPQEDPEVHSINNVNNQSILPNNPDWLLIYPNGHCPGCDDPIPSSKRPGESCNNCGHVFHLNMSVDDRLTDVDGSDDDFDNYLDDMSHYLYDEWRKRGGQRVLSNDMFAINDMLRAWFGSKRSV